MTEREEQEAALEMLDRIIAAKPKNLTPWEYKFIDSLDHKRQYPQSGKQMKVLKRIDSKVFKPKD